MEDMVVVKDLVKSFGGAKAVQGVSFTVRPGEIFGILGPNGAGKTTTLSILEGILPRDGGQVRVMGMDPGRGERRLKDRIGVQFQSTSIQPRLKVREALELFSSFYPKRRDPALLAEKLGLRPYLDQEFDKLSGGWKQRVTLALAMIHDPDLLFLDEPSTGLDPKARRDLWELILELKREGKTVILSTHYMEEAERLCDRVAMFHRGTILGVDSPRNLARTWNRSRRLSLICSEAEIRDLEKLPSVTEAARDGDRIILKADSLQRAAGELFRLAEERGWHVEDFRFETGTLEELFVKLAEEGGDPDEKPHPLDGGRDEVAVS